MEDKKILLCFRNKKILTIEELTHLLKSSAITARRRLKKWNTFTSINCNGRYYVLPDVAKFDEHGLWHYQRVYFSRHGNLRETILQLINKSDAGLTAQEIGRLVGLQANSSFLSGFRDVSGIHREKREGKFVYFSGQREFKLQQQQHRDQLIKTKSRELPSDAEAILILVDRIKHPESSLEQTAQRLQKKSKHLRVDTIFALLEYHGLLKKTPDTCLL